MPFCPSCRAEYQAGKKVCDDCETVLVDELASAPDATDMVDVYICYNDQIADRAVALLEENGMEVLVRDRTSSAFPTNVGESAERCVAVSRAQKTQALSVLGDAIEDTVLAGDGHLVER